MRLPDFLIIGAMKAGTTTLYRDLLAEPAVYFPHRKEPNNLVDDAVLANKGQSKYAWLFAAARPDQICGEASTAYTKAPDYSGVPQRAKQVLGDHVRIIYLVRDPIARIVSHYTHRASFGAVAAPFDQAVRTDPQYLNYSRYAMQIEPWIEQFGVERVKILVLEEYVNDRASTVTDVCRFLGITPTTPKTSLAEAHNTGRNRRAKRGPAAAFRSTRFYRRLIRPWLPIDVRDRLRQSLLPKADIQPPNPTPETVDFIVDSLREDAERLRTLLGRVEPIWDFEAAKRRHEGRPNP